MNFASFSMCFRCIHYNHESSYSEVLSCPFVTMCTYVYDGSSKISFRVLRSTSFRCAPFHRAIFRRRSLRASIEKGLLLVGHAVVCWDRSSLLFSYKVVGQKRLNKFVLSALWHERSHGWSGEPEVFVLWDFHVWKARKISCWSLSRGMLLWYKGTWTKFRIVIKLRFKSWVGCSAEGGCLTATLHPFYSFQDLPDYSNKINVPINN